MTPWNGKCPKCSADAYFGLMKIECSNKACKNYHPPPKGSEAEEKPKPKPQPAIYDDYYGNCDCPDCMTCGHSDSSGGIGPDGLPLDTSVIPNHGTGGQPTCGTPDDGYDDFMD